MDTSVNGTLWGIRTLDLLLRRQLLYPAELKAHIKMERVMGIEPTQPAWKAGILTIELHPHIWNAMYIIIHNEKSQQKSLISLTKIIRLNISHFCRSPYLFFFTTGSNTVRI